MLAGTSGIITQFGSLWAVGARFKGVSEASGGNGGQNSSSNYPLVQLLSLVNEQTLFLPVDAVRGWNNGALKFWTDNRYDHEFERLSDRAMRLPLCSPTVSPANRSS